MERVVAIETTPGHYEAWALALLRHRGSIHSGALLIKWQRGQVGRDVGNVIVQRQMGDRLVDVPYDVTFASAFHAFRAGSPIYKDTPE
jgi:hypothetical protein